MIGRGTGRTARWLATAVATLLLVTASPRGAVAAPQVAASPEASVAESQARPSGGAAPTDALPTVILLAWDGVRHDYPDRASLAALGRMQREGVRAERLIPPYPSSTFPSLVTLATGTYPDRHGIVDNHFRDRERGEYDRDADPSWIEAEPLWVAAERQGVPSAAFFWVGSERDWRGRGARHRKTPFDSGVGEAEKVDQILAWLDLPPPDRPRLIVAWWHGADHAGHAKGPDHADVMEQLAGQDRELERLMAGIDARGLWSRTTLIVVSDHGMTAVADAVPVAERLDEAGIDAEVTRGAAVAHVFLADPSMLAAARTVLSSLEGVRVYAGAELPASFRFAHPQRTGDLVLTVEPPRTFVLPGLAERAFRATGLLDGERGMHGFDPALPDMGGVFFAYGRGVPRGERLGPVRAIDVAPTVSWLLGIAPPGQAEGRSVLSPTVAASGSVD